MGFCDCEACTHPADAAQSHVCSAYACRDQVTLTEMRMAVVGVFKNRLNLSSTLKDTKTVVSKLERMIGAGLHLVFILFYLTIWNVRVPFSHPFTCVVVAAGLNYGSMHEIGKATGMYVYQPV